MASRGIPANPSADESGWESCPGLAFIKGVRHILMVAISGRARRGPGSQRAMPRVRCGGPDVKRLLSLGAADGENTATPIACFKGGRCFDTGLLCLGSRPLRQASSVWRASGGSVPIQRNKNRLNQAPHPNPRIPFSQVPDSPLSLASIMGDTLWSCSLKIQASTFPADQTHFYAPANAGYRARAAPGHPFVSNLYVRLWMRTSAGGGGIFRTHARATLCGESGLSPASGRTQAKRRQYDWRRFICRRTRHALLANEARFLIPPRLSLTGTSGSSAVRIRMCLSSAASSASPFHRFASSSSPLSLSPPPSGRQTQLSHPGES